MSMVEALGFRAYRFHGLGFSAEGLGLIGFRFFFRT